MALSRHFKTRLQTIFAFPRRFWETYFSANRPTRFMNRRVLFLRAIIIATGVIFSTFAYENYYSPRGIGCPAIFADVTFPDYKGFVTVTHQTATTTEFVLFQNGIGDITVSY
jgi:hypothetical protein